MLLIFADMFEHRTAQRHSALPESGRRKSDVHPSQLARREGLLMEPGRFRHRVKMLNSRQSDHLPVSPKQNGMTRQSASRLKQRDQWQRAGGERRKRRQPFASGCASGLMNSLVPSGSAERAI
jgi:hypothetical protein